MNRELREFRRLERLCLEQAALSMDLTRSGLLKVADDCRIAAEAIEAQMPRRAFTGAVQTLMLVLSTARISPPHQRRRPDDRVGELRTRARASSVLCRRGFTRQSFGFQPLLVGVKRLLRLFMVAHGLFGLDASCRIASLALFGGQGFASE